MMFPMTKRLDEAIAKVRALPEDHQDQVADVLFAVLQTGDAPDLTDEELETVRQSREAIRRGDVATDEEMEEVWRRFGLA
jgi:dihydrodipicolinate synthase/N-acetylneuraminate lyase